MQQPANFPVTTFDGPEVDVSTENVVVQVTDVDVSLPDDDDAVTANRQ